MDDTIRLSLQYSINCIIKTYLLQPHNGKGEIAEAFDGRHVRRVLHLQVELHSDDALEWHAELWLDLEIGLVLRLIRSQTIHFGQQTRIRLIEVRIGDVDRRAVLTRTDILQADHRRLVVVRVEAGRVFGIAERILRQDVQVCIDS